MAEIEPAWQAPAPCRWRTDLLCCGVAGAPRLNPTASNIPRQFLKLEKRISRKFLTALRLFKNTQEQSPEAAIREAKNGNIESPIAVVVLRLRQVIQATGLARSSIYTLMQSGEFPKSIRLSARSVGWRSDEVAQWIEDRTEISNKLEWSAS